MRWNAEGFTILEMITVLAVIALVASLGVPPVLDFGGDVRLHLAAQEVAGTLRLARSEAIRRGVNVAVKFQPAADGRTTYRLYRDGDGDGVMNRDIDRGVDRPVTLPRPFEVLGGRMHFGFPPGRKVRDPGAPRAWLPIDDPIRFNQSDLASYSPLGTSTPGSLYVTDGRNRLIAVRVYNRTGKVKIIQYDFDDEVWR
jgi:prepilin-type N-terminal cleavage/methylation domain-containing protein